MRSQIEYPDEALPPLGTTLRVAAGIEWLRMPLPFALDHINLWLIAEGDAWVAIDTGIALDNVKDCWRSVLHGRRLSRQIVTHFHPDHLGLAAWLEQETGAPLLMTQDEYIAAQSVIDQVPPFDAGTMMDFFADHGLQQHWLDALKQRGNGYRRGVPAVPATYQRIQDGDVMAIGTHDWRVMVGRGHAPEHASLYCGDLGVLIAGDMLLPRISTNVSAFASQPERDALGDFLDSIRAFTALPEDTLVLPSHGLPFRGVHYRVNQLVEHHAARCDELVAACDEPRTAAELLPVLFRRELKDAHQVMFAMGEAIAHLVHLEHQQQLEHQRNDGISRFVRRS